jgi:WD40 repeat protein
MHRVESAGINGDWIAESHYPMWKELNADITFHHVIPFLNPSDIGKGSLVCKQWNGYLTSDDVWKPLSHYHFPSLTPDFFKSFQDYHRIYTNLSRGVCSLKTLRGHEDAIHSLALADTTLLSASGDCSIGMWDLNTNRRINIPDWNINRICGISSLALRGATLFSGLFSGEIEIWDLNTKAHIGILEGHTELVLSLVARDDTLFSASCDKTIKIWDLSTNTRKATLRGHTKEVYSLALGSENLFSASCDSTIRIWDLRTNTCTAVLEGHNGVIFSLALRGKTLFSGSLDNTIKIWNLNTNTCTATLEGHKRGLMSFALRDTTLFSCAMDGMIKIWDLNTNTCTATLQNYNQNLNGVNQNKRCVNVLALKDVTLFSASTDRIIRIWNFAANYDEIFMEIIHALQSEDEVEVECALDRFSKMPKVAKTKVFGEFSKIINPELEPGNSLKCAEDVFYERNGQSATNAQRAKAIENYLGKLPK